MNENDWLAEQFEGQRAHLQGVAYRMLGSLSEADDAIQAAWLRVSRADTSGVENMGGWLTTIVARVCLDMLRTRKSRREEPLDVEEVAPTRGREDGVDPEREAQLVDSVGLALLVVLDALAPDERLAFVLHDIFGVSFTQIAPIVGRTPVAARQLASRARRRVRGSARVPSAELGRQREVVEAFLAAARAGDFEALLAVLDPDVAVRRDDGWELSGAQAVAKHFSQPGSARGVRPALVDGVVGIIAAVRGHLTLAVTMTVTGGRIARMEGVTDPARLAGIALAALDG